MLPPYMKNNVTNSLTGIGLRDQLVYLKDLSNFSQSSLPYVLSAKTPQDSVSGPESTSYYYEFAKILLQYI